MKSAEDVTTAMTAQPTSDSRYALARSQDAHTAQLTLISILLGAILGALISALPPNPSTFAQTIWQKNHLILDLQVLATLLAAIDLWVKYSWGIILYKWPFTLHHNLIYFLVAVALMGTALSVKDVRAWLAWLATFAITACIAYLRNQLVPDIPCKERMRNATEGLVAGSAALALIYAALASYHQLPAWLPWETASLPMRVWVIAVNIALIVDVGIQAVFMKAERGEVVTPI